MFKENDAVYFERSLSISHYLSSILYNIIPFALSAIKKLRSSWVFLSRQGGTFRDSEFRSDVTNFFKFCCVFLLLLLEAAISLLETRKVIYL